MIWRAAPPVLDGLGLVGALAALVDRRASTADGGPSSSWTARRRPARAHRASSTGLYVISREASAATPSGTQGAVRERAALQLGLDGDQGAPAACVLTVADDGVGFDHEAVAGRRPFWLTHDGGAGGARRRLVHDHRRRGRRHSRRGHRPARGPIVSDGRSARRSGSSWSTTTRWCARACSSCSPLPDVDVVGEAGTAGRRRRHRCDASQVVLLDLKLRGDAGPRGPGVPCSGRTAPPAVLILTVHDDEEFVRRARPRRRARLRAQAHIAAGSWPTPSGAWPRGALTSTRTWWRALLAEAPQERRRSTRESSTCCVCWPPASRTGRSASGST